MRIYRTISLQGCKDKGKTRCDVDRKQYAAMYRNISIYLCGCVSVHVKKNPKNLFPKNKVLYMEITGFIYNWKKN